MNYKIIRKCLTASKALSLITAFLVSSILATGQNTVAVALLKMNVLYIGVDNPVSIAASNASNDKITVGVDGGGGTVSKTDAGAYNVRVTTPTDDCTINVYVDGRLQGSSKFRVRQLPQPNGTIGGFLSGANISADVLRTQHGLGLYVQNSPFEMKYEVESFSLIIPDDKGNIKKVDCQGSLFSQTAKEYMNQYLKSGDIVSIEDIRVKTPGGTSLKVPAVFYNIR